MFHEKFLIVNFVLHKPGFKFSASRASLSSFFICFAYFFASWKVPSDSSVIITLSMTELW